MNRDVLEKIGFKELKKLVRLLDLDIEDEYLSTCSDENRAVLINLVYEELEEVRKERDDSNTLPIHYQERRFSNLEDVFGRQIDFTEEGFDFTEIYNVTRVSLMLRDPQWVFAYWDISILDRKHIETNNLGDGLCIIVQEQPRNDGGALERVEIPVTILDNRWYISLPRRDTFYSAVLGYYDDKENFEVLAHSNIIQVPRGNISPSYLSSISAETELVSMLSIIEKLGISDNSPEEEYLQLQSE